MTISKRVREQMLKLCGSICEEDGQDARKYFEKEQKEKRSSDEYRQLRLCKQVRETLSLVMAEAPCVAIRSACVADVVPGSRPSLLVVRIKADEQSSPEEKSDLLRQLKLQDGWLRSELTSAITRKRVPQLTFEVQTPVTGEEVTDVDD